LEQAYFFLRPIVQEVFGTEVEIELIGISRISGKSVIAESISEAISIRNPDGVITLVDEKDVEHPLVWLEFSTQVETFDHLSQSFNSYTAAGSCRIPFVKFYASRRSRSSHGGEQAFDAKILFQILFSKFNTPGIQLDWPVTDNSRFAVRDVARRACPPSDLGLREILEVCKLGLETGRSPADALIEFAQKGATPLAVRFQENLQSPPTYSGPTRATRFYKRNGRWVLKFNRWDHSMDPERGMAELYHNWIEEKLVGRLHDKVAIDVRTAIRNFTAATGIRISMSTELAGRIDITESIVSSSLNRAGLVIAWCCDEFTVADQSGTEIVTFYWNVSKPTGLVTSHSVSTKTHLVEKLTVTEDEVTFVVANLALPANSFRMHSVSYPGAQGDFALITGEGRKSKRKYFDVIAMKDSKSANTVILLESKGIATAEKLRRDADTLIEWRDGSQRTFLLSELGVESTADLVTGIAVVGDSEFDFDCTSNLDFKVIVDQSSWQIFVQNSSMTNLFSVLKGSCELPKRYVY
jgi:hypothetical protein